MDERVYRRSLQFLLFQRNVLMVISLCLVATLLIGSLFLFSKRSRVIVVPPTVDRAFWIEEGAVSATYLEQFGGFLGQLLLSKSAASAQSQGNALLRHADPAFFGALREKLLNEDASLNAQGASYVFYPERIDTNLKELEVRLEGERTYYLNGQRASFGREAYVMSFRHAGGRLLLTGVRLEDAIDG